MGGLTGIGWTGSMENDQCRWRQSRSVRHCYFAATIIFIGGTLVPTAFTAQNAAHAFGLGYKHGPALRKDVCLWKEAGQRQPHGIIIFSQPVSNTITDDESPPSHDDTFVEVNNDAPLN